MPPRSGSKPVRDLICELGGKEGNPPDMATTFYETRKKDNKLMEPETIEKYEELLELVEKEPSLSNIEGVDKKCKHVIGYGGGIRAKDLRGSSTKAELQAKLNEIREENQTIKSCLNSMEAELKMLKVMIRSQQSNAQPSTPLLLQNAN